MAKILTPTKDLSREEWINFRRLSIGGSDAASVIGLNPWKSKFTLFYDKKGKLEDKTDNEAMRIGRDLEDYVAKRFCEATEKKVRRRNAMFMHDEHDFITANIDREVVGENAGLECKTTSAFTKSDFAGGQIPLYYYCQCMHYMAVMGYDKIYLAVLVLGRAFYWFEIPRNDAEINNLIFAEVDFWQNYILTDTPPAPDGSDSTTETIAELYPDSVEKISLFGFEQNARQYIELGEKIKELKALQDEQKNILLAELKEAAGADLDGYEISNKAVTSKRLDSKKLKADMPEIYEKYTNEAISKRFIIKEAEANDYINN